MKRVSNKTIITVILSSILILSLGVCSCGACAGVVFLTRRASPGSLVLNEDDSSNHIGRAVVNGTQYDFWVQRDVDGTSAYVSDTRIQLKDSTEIYLQLDSLGRPSFVRHPNGYSLRVNFYLEGNQADVTFTDPEGNSLRGVMDANLLMSGAPSSPVAQSRCPGLASPLDAEPDACELIWGVIHSGRLFNTFKDFIVVLGCIAGISFDIATFPDVVTSLAACAGAYAVSTVITEALVEYAEGLAERALECDYDARDLGEDEAPESPATTGQVEVGGGDVHITLTWDKATDVDLHVIDPSGEEIWYEDPTSASGGELDVDDTNGHGPENIFWPRHGAPHGQYRVVVVYYDSNGKGTTNYDVVVRYGSTIEEYSGTLTQNGEQDVITTFNYSE